MAQPQPMDRLICGDVGYGKTEVAIRAAFKAVDAGKQVAVLVPTTILAEQHHRSFSSADGRVPVHRSRSSTASGPNPRSATSSSGPPPAGVDILIGTHRLVQKDVAFKDLGLVVIDEEQRFGVEDKEWLKSLRSTVDVLTLSATPIPRTLHMSLLGIRDISNLETPPARPQGDRDPHPPVRPRDDPAGDPPRAEPRRPGLLRPQPGLRHPAASPTGIQAIVPEARIAIGHGQMAGEALEKTMLALHPPRVRHPRRHHDHRVGPGHPQRQHDLHQRGRQVRPGRPAPASRPRRPLQAPGVCLPAARIGPAGHAQRRQAAQGDRGVHRAGGRVQDRAARPGDPRGGEHPRGRAVRAHRERRLRAVLLAPRIGRAVADAASPTSRCSTARSSCPGGRTCRATTCPARG